MKKQANNKQTNKQASRKVVFKTFEEKRGKLGLSDAKIA